MTASKTFPRSWTGTATLALCVLLSACASTPPTPEALVTRRAQARWDALLKNDLKTAYGFLSPASRAVASFDTWANSAFPSATVWKGARVAAVTCDDAQRCKARVTIDHQPLVLDGRLGTISSAVDETWLIDNGEWWLLYTR